MPHVITQSCCSDGSCVYACPVNCIHPSPDEPGFATAEMLYIDPAACVDCGACVSACPVGAIAPESKLAPQQLPFVALNAAFYPPLPPGEKLPPTSTLAPVIPAPRLRRRDGLAVAIVGSGPAAMYAADELLTQPGVRVTVLEKLPTPYGLVRAGVAPDHQHTKGVTRLFDTVTRHRGLRLYGNVEVGAHVTHDELLAHHHAVIYAVGAPNDRRLAIDGVDLPGSMTATELVAWINGHPDAAHVPVDLTGERVVVVGNGNVALDVARILTTEPDALARTDISDEALAVLRRSQVREVVIAARRGPAESAFTLPELIGLTGTHDVVLSSGDHALVAYALETATDPLVRAKLEVLATLPDAAHVDGGPRIRLTYRLTPQRITGAERVTGMAFTVTGTDRQVRLDAGLVLSSIGYRGRPVAGLPFDDAAGVVPNDGGRVTDGGAPVPGAYVAGWIKRGPTGFIGTNKSCARETVQQLVDDANAGRLTGPTAGPQAFEKLLRGRQPRLVDAAGWHAIDAAERARGEAQGRPRVKFTDVDEMLAAAATARRPAPARRLLADLLR
ncbi:FAD-dependent oxidoreductase [Mycobacterium sp. MYCO198283]|uniref:FAD-dependent oxidoreductase n=1 Tax=Mycobacterium sp. MYCO198283 TaxID=2883505 RepID=UPI001E3AC1B4|nr:FAD-dependent oxidoreductase [Mycobacterium sp. MYCO198283]MCG5431137.1 FAD-dependent oxidoreductase [Mycobacterium sp. MYCO198283]